uniref:Stabilizer of axonemal microtubules 2 n=1 Tax=Mus musculus TaxID=10090 RepID=A0A140LHB8_MOUSE
MYVTYALCSWIFQVSWTLHRTKSLQHFPAPPLQQTLLSLMSLLTLEFPRHGGLEELSNQDASQQLPAPLSLGLYCILCPTKNK